MQRQRAWATAAERELTAALWARPSERTSAGLPLRRTQRPSGPDALAGSQPAWRAAAQAARGPATPAYRPAPRSTPRAAMRRYARFGWQRARVIRGTTREAKRPLTAPVVSS